MHTRRILTYIALALIISVFTASTGHAVTAQVIRVIDGDTFITTLNGQKERVRLIGVDTPETVHPKKGIEPYGLEASAYVKGMLEGREVFLEFDVASRDRYGRLLAYVWLFEPADQSDASIRRNMLNANLLLNGYARLMTVPPNVRYADYFVKYEEEGRIWNRGLWGIISGDFEIHIQDVPTVASTSQSNERSNDSGLKWFGLLGVVCGGLIGFGGSYFTNRQNIKHDKEERQKEFMRNMEFQRIEVKKQIIAILSKYQRSITEVFSTAQLVRVYSLDLKYLNDALDNYKTTHQEFYQCNHDNRLFMSNNLFFELLQLLNDDPISKAKKPGLNVDPWIKQIWDNSDVIVTYGSRINNLIDQITSDDLKVIIPINRKLADQPDVEKKEKIEATSKIL
ncbi:thermonuclease family protein [Cloacibacillus porcorum]